MRKGARLVGLVAALVVLGVVGTLVAGCVPRAAPRATPTPAVIEWRMAGIWGPGPAAYLPEGFAKKVEELSNGRLKVKTFPGGQLYGAGELFSAIQKGLVELVECPTGYWGGAMPVYMVPDTPFLVKDNSELRPWWEAGLKDIFAREAEKKGIKLLGFVEWNGLQLYSPTPIYRLEDVQGRKIRAYNPPTTMGVEALGASSTVIPFVEVYTALQQGVIDGAFGGVTWAQAFKWPEAAPNITVVGFGVPPTGVFVNMEAFNTLPPDLQQVLIEAGDWYTNHGWEKVDEFTEEMYRIFEQEGRNVIRLSPEERQRWVDKVKHIWIKVAKSLGPEALEALAVYEKVFPGRIPWE
jgi:TRAP-type C4-dicarboxylate transport system substrate-binding protein